MPIMKRLLIVSNRLPVTVKTHKGIIDYTPSGGGLATGMASLNGDYEKHWIGWPGVHPKTEEMREQITATLGKDNIHPVFLSPQEIEEYYEGFSNKTIWPLFHYFTEFANYNQDFWIGYQHVNELFLKELKKIVQPDDLIWIHDYHLMLLPGLIRDEFPTNKIGFFLHIPFPSYELFRTLPWREEILDGLLGADLIGLHTYEYMRHFLIAIQKIKDIEPRLGKFYIKDHLIQVDAFPMGIDYEKFNKASQNKKVQQKVKIFKDNFGSHKLILSIDRLDYSKGIPQRLKAFDRFLAQYPDYQGKVTLVVVVVPSRSEVDKYNELKIEIDEAVGSLNGKYATMEWTPIQYYYRNLPFHEMVALYFISDIALVTPFRDGMNLIAKEYVASQTEGKGVLILSEMAGASNVLLDAIHINPNDIEDISNALFQALNMPNKEQKQRIEKMQQQIRENTVQRWASNFIENLEKLYQIQREINEKVLTEEKQLNILNHFFKATQAILFISYDGSVVPYKEDPDKAFPDKEVLGLFRNLSELPKLKIVLISGRDHLTLSRWFGDIKIDIVAEYGTQLRENNRWTQMQILHDEWKDEIYIILNEFMSKTPGSFIEEKSYSLAWHYRSSDAFLADMRIQDLINSLIYPCTKHNLEIIDGDKVIEVKPVGVDKKTVLRHWLNKKQWDFVLALGNDKTDEDLFDILPQNAFSIRVGKRQTNAKYTLRYFNESLVFLKKLANFKQPQKKKMVY
jgi:trehalose 6-phosphate synthase/phosphatase